MLKRAAHLLYKISEWMEFVMAVFVAVSIVISFATMIPEISTLWLSTEGSVSLIHFLEEILNIVIAIEFLKMLCKPTSDTIIEVLIFLEARHMIIGETSPMEDLLLVTSIAILFMIQLAVKHAGGLRRMLTEVKMKSAKHTDDVDLDAAG